MEQNDGNTQEDKGDPHLQSVSAPAGLCHASSASMYPSKIHQSLWKIRRTKSYTTFEYHKRHTTAGHLTSPSRPIFFTLTVSRTRGRP